jgi:hypothetical protein
MSNACHLDTSSRCHQQQQHPPHHCEHTNELKNSPNVDEEIGLRHGFFFPLTTIKQGRCLTGIMCFTLFLYIRYQLFFFAIEWSCVCPTPPLFYLWTLRTTAHTVSSFNTSSQQAEAFKTTQCTYRKKLHRPDWYAMESDLRHLQQQEVWNRYIVRS